MVVNSDTCRPRITNFDYQIIHSQDINRFNYENALKIIFYLCPACKKTTIKLEGLTGDIRARSLNFYPNSNAKQFPDYIPEAIRNDYEEAYSIIHLSPKASATLARRCLQGIIRDFWGIKLNTLNQEITALKNEISADLWNAIDSLRQLGNIGAHMEKDINTIIDIDPGEAEILIQLIELLIKEWYINREERNQLLAQIPSINVKKQEQRKPKE